MGILRQAVDAVNNYGNLGRTVAQRVWPKAFRHFEIVDRRSGITCEARPGSEKLFNEIWFDHDYDVPGIPLRPGDVVLDVGGNQGFYACYAAAQGARVFSFEPDLENAALFRRNVGRNGFDKQVTLLPCAVQARSGKTTFYTTPTLGGGMNTTTSSFAREGAHREAGEVPCVSLADHVAAHQIGAIRICKLDCEGAEMEIVKSLLRKWPRSSKDSSSNFTRQPTGRSISSRPWKTWARTICSWPLPSLTVLAISSGACPERRCMRRRESGSQSDGNRTTLRS